MIEEWKPIDGFSGRYEVSNSGLVRSFHGKRWKPKTLSLQDGYLVANLSENNWTVRRMVHQLVARAFIGPPPEGLDSINHLDGNKQNNTPSNLEWCTRSDNMKHAWRTGLCRAPKLTAEQVAEIRACGGLDTPVAKRFGVSQVLVTKIRAGKVWNSENHQPTTNEATP